MEHGNTLQGMTFQFYEDYFISHEIRIAEPEQKSGLFQLISLISVGAVAVQLT